MEWLEALILIGVAVFTAVVFMLEILNVLSRFRGRRPRKADLITGVRIRTGRPPRLHPDRRRRLLPFFQ